MTSQEYLESLDKWMHFYGFTKMDIQQGLEVERFFWKSGNEASKIGLTDRYCYFKSVPDETGVQFLRSYSSALYDYSYQHKQTLKRFFRSMMIVFPVILVNKASNELISFIRNYHTRKFKSVEFPSIIELSTGEIHCCEKTPFYGALYYNGFRRDSYNFFAPKSWHLAAQRK